MSAGGAGARVMIGQTRAEFLKIRSTRTTLGLVLGLIALVLLFVLLTGLVSKVDDLTDAESQRNLLGIGSLAGLFSALAGVLLVTSEFRFGTITPTFLFSPRRSRVVVAKVTAGLLAGLVFAVVGEGIAFAIGYAILSGRGISVSLGGGDIAVLLVGVVVSSALWGAIGVAVGAIVRNQIGAVVGLLAWGFVVESLLFAFVPSVGRLTPGEAQNALMGLTTRHLLSPGAGGAVLVAWTCVLACVAAVVTARRDVG